MKLVKSKHLGQTLELKNRERDFCLYRVFERGGKGRCENVFAQRAKQFDHMWPFRQLFTLIFWTVIFLKHINKFLYGNISNFYERFIHNLEPIL